MPSWTFVTNHAVVLSYVAAHPRITAIEMARKIGITERAVRGIIKDLVDEGYLSKTKEGRRVLYGVDKTRPLRHSTQKEKIVEDLLRLLHKGKTLF